MGGNCLTRRVVSRIDRATIKLPLHSCPEAASWHWARAAPHLSVDFQNMRAVRGTRSKHAGGQMQSTGHNIGSARIACHVSQNRNATVLLLTTVNLKGIRERFWKALRFDICTCEMHSRDAWFKHLRLWSRNLYILHRDRLSQIQHADEAIRLVTVSCQTRLLNLVRVGKQNMVEFFIHEPECLLAFRNHLIVFCLVVARSCSAGCIQN